MTFEVNVGDSKQHTAAPHYPMLRDHRLLRGLDDASVHRIADSLPTIMANPGDVLITEGDLASHMYIVMTGELEVLTRGGVENANVRVALLGPGDWVGEMALLDVQPRSATVRALAPTSLVRIGMTDVKELLYEHDVGQYALLVMNIARELSRRLRVADGLIARSSFAREYVETSQFPSND